jgi:hypothetical protein
MTTLNLSHRRNEKCEFKKCRSNVKIKINNKTWLNKEFINEVHWNIPNIYIFVILIF